MTGHHEVRMFYIDHLRQSKIETLPSGWKPFAAHYDGGWAILARKWVRDETKTKEEPTCDSFGCTLPAGHNRGRADVPENHETKKET
jgi:hypothetical protein